MKKASLVISAVVWLGFSCGKDKNSVDNSVSAAFSVSGYEAAVPCTITFINTSRNATSYLWDFGDGTTSTLFNPTHTYTGNGTFQPKLTATGPNGSQTVCKELALVFPPAANRTAFSYYKEKCTGTPVGISFKSMNPASTNPVWDLGNGGQALEKNPIGQYLLPGDYTIKYSTILSGVRDTAVLILRIQ